MTAATVPHVTQRGETREQAEALGPPPWTQVTDQNQRAPAGGEGDAQNHMDATLSAKGIDWGVVRRRLAYCPCRWSQTPQ